MSFFRETRERYESELTGRIIPFWERHSIDAANGGFFSCLERDGTVYDTLKQMWMQWREVYMFAALYNSRFRNPRFLEYAERGYDFLFRHGRKPDGSYYYLLDASGRPVSEHEGGAEIFSESFAAIACAEIFRASGDPRYREESLRCWNLYWNRALRTEQPDPRFPGAIARRQFAYYMIALNVLTVIREAFPEAVPEERIEFMIDHILRFIHPDSGILFERVLPDGRFDTHTQDGRFINPGHALEGLGFLLESCRRRKAAGPVPQVLRTIRVMLEYGWDSEQGGIFYFRDFLGKPLQKNECMLKAWWPQNEAATAALLAYEFSGEEFFLDFFRRIDAYSWKCLRDPDFPEWFAYAAVDGRQVHSCKGSRWKGFFHLPRYLLNCAEICRRLE